MYDFFSVSRDQKAPLFKKKPAIRQEEDGERLLFECIIVANPEPSISWFRDEVPVVPKDRFRVSMLIISIITYAIKRTCLAVSHLARQNSEEQICALHQSELAWVKMTPPWKLLLTKEEHCSARVTVPAPRKPLEIMVTANVDFRHFSAGGIFVASGRIL